jgi:hypothetical protein
MMNNSANFNFNRFWALLRLDWATQRKWLYFLPSVMIVFTVYIFFGLGNLNLENANNTNLYSMFVMSILMPSFIYGTIYFQALKLPENARQYLLLPATIYEKWAVKMFFAVIFFPIIAITFNWLLITGFQYAILHKYAFRYAPITGEVILNMLPIQYLILFQALTTNLLGKKSGFVAILLIIGLYFKFSSIIKSFFPYNDREMTPLTGISLVGFYEYSEKAYQWHTIYLATFFIPIALLCVASCYLLKEKEAI